MDGIGKKVTTILVGLALFIVIQQVRSRFGESSSGGESKITQEDADLYLKVMRQAAERVKNPPPEDVAIVDAFNQIPNVRTAQASQLTDDQKNTVFQAIKITGSLDEVVAESLHVDASKYEKAKGAIEDVFPFPESDSAASAGELTDTQKKALSSNAKVLAPAADEIKELQATIYNNPLRKKVHGD